MTPKAYLQRVANAEREIRTIKARIAHYREMGISSPGDMENTPVSHSIGTSRPEMIAVSIIDALDRLNANLGAYSAIVSDAEKLIALVPQERYRRILTLHYLCGWKLQRVGDELGYQDKNSIYRAHGWALNEFGKVMRKAGKGE